MSGLRFGLLGPVEVTRDGRAVALKSARQRVVLVMLLMAADHVVTVDRLIDAVWDGEEPDTARMQIQICVSALRRALGSGVIETSVGGYAIHVAGDQLDVAEFDECLRRARLAAGEGRLAEALADTERALALWRGPALSGETGRTPEALAHRLEERRLMAVETRIEICLGLGAHRELVDELVALTAEHPLRERLRGFLMVALYRSGRQAEALAVYDDARKELSEELGLEPGEDLRKLEGAILAHDESIASPESGPEPRSRGPAFRPPRELPADIPDFVGHAGLVAELAAALDEPDGIPVAVLTGPPGCGKSTVAVHVAHAVRERFPDGQLFADLHGSAAQGTPPGDVLARFLRALGVPPDAIPDTEERAALLRSQLASRRVLIVLDDAAGEEQFRDLIPGVPGSAVLVTSRSRLVALPGARPVELPAMTDEEGVDLLGRVAGRERVTAEPEATVELARLCGGLPLALRIAGVRLAAHPHWSVATLTDMMADESTRLDELTHGGVGIRGLLSVVHESLSEPARQLFGLLGAVETHDFTPLTAAALLDADLGRATRALDELVDARLLDVTGGRPPRYRFQDLVRVYAAERLAASPADAARAPAAVERVLSCLLALAREAYQRTYGGDFTRIRGSAGAWPGARRWFDRLLADPLEWFDAERATLRAAVTQAASLGHDEICWELAIDAVAAYEARGLFDDWRATHTVALAATRAAGNRRGEAAVMMSLGSLAVAQRTEDDTAMLLGAFDLFEALGDDLGQAMCLRNLAHLDRVQGHPERALERYERALEGFRRADDVGGQAHVLSGLARAHLDLGLLVEAEALTKESLTLAQQLGNQRLQAQALFRLGEVMTRSDQLMLAKAVLQQALELTQGLDDRVGEAYALNALATAELALTELDAAEVHFARSAETSKAINERNTYAHATLGLGRVHAERGRHDAAEDFCLRAVRAFAAQRNGPMHDEALETLRSVRRAAGRPAFPE